MTSTFDLSTPEEIRSGAVTDVYFLRAREVMRAAGEDPQVVVELRAEGLPASWPWAVFSGLDSVLDVLENRPLDVEALPEGSVFYAEEPVLVITGRYLDFSLLETAILGLVCQASGIATAAARCRIAAEDRPVYAFGARRVHPGIAAMVERAAFTGGCDGVSTVKGAEHLGVEPVGTMSHATSLVLGDERAWEGFDRTIDARVPRVALVDTSQDERQGALAAARLLGKRLAAVRIDTPASRRGDFASIVREIRWELDANGFSNVKILVSGGLDEQRILLLNRFADAYGVGTAITNAPVIEFSLDIVEVDGKARSKRGKLSGRKHLWGCPQCGNRGISRASDRLGQCPRCGHRVRSLLVDTLHKGRRRGRAPSPFEVRSLTLDEIRAAPDPFGRER
jgi:nicotinate phosphoribosyltransferase